MHRFLLIVGLSFAGIFASQGVGQDKSAPETKDNTPPKGFTALFNGKDLTGWQGLIDLKKRMKLAATPDKLAEVQKVANEKILPHWTVKDGVLNYDGKADSLQTAKDYGNVELYVDWKIGPKGDSGIYLRGNPQVQIWDTTKEAGYWKHGADKGSGALWNNEKNARFPLVHADRPVGEWNTMYIKMIGDKVTVKLNGKLVVDDTPLENVWERGKPLPVRGPIELQHHGNPLWFKNIYVKELPD